LTDKLAQPAGAQFQLKALLLVGACGADQAFRGVVAGDGHAGKSLSGWSCACNREVRCPRFVNGRARPVHGVYRRLHCRTALVCESKILKRIGRAKNGYQLAAAVYVNTVVLRQLNRGGSALCRDAGRGAATSALTGAAMPVSEMPERETPAVHFTVLIPHEEGCFYGPRGVIVRRLIV